MNSIAFRVVMLLMLAAAVLGHDGTSSQQDACSWKEKVAMAKALEGLGDELEDVDLPFDDLVARIFRDCDIDEDSFIGLDELVACIFSWNHAEKFVEAVADISKTCKDAVLQAADIDGDSRLGDQEMRRLLTTMGVE